MADNIPTCAWLGKSGKRYPYYILPLPAMFNPHQPGNYIYTKINPANNKWTPIYIGHGDLATNVNPNHPMTGCIALKGATHVHVHSEAVEENRVAEVKDLLAMYTNAFAPNGCNPKT